VTSSADDESLAADLAERLRDAHRRVASLTLPDEQKSSAARRLLAISDASKHDVSRAARRLDAFLDDLDAGRTTAAGTPSEGPVGGGAA
jgi:DNA-binding LacI/PurR family transcriptional regulator